MVVGLQGVGCPGRASTRPLEGVPHLDLEIWCQASCCSDRCSNPCFLKVSQERKLVLQEMGREGFKERYNISNRDESQGSKFCTLTRKSVSSLYFCIKPRRLTWLSSEWVHCLGAALKVPSPHHLTDSQRKSRLASEVRIGTRSGPGPESKNFQGSSKGAGIVSERSDISSARARSGFKVTASFRLRRLTVFFRDVCAGR